MMKAITEISKYTIVIVQSLKDRDLKTGSKAETEQLKKDIMAEVEKKKEKGDNSK